MKRNSIILKSKEYSVVSRCLLLAILLFLLIIGVVNLQHFNYKMNADIASDAILGKLIWEEKQIIPRSWYVANELRIICTPNLSALFFGLTHNMTLSTGIACCVMTLLICQGMFFGGEQLGWKKEEILLFVFLGLALPANLAIIELLYLFASYYAIHVVLFFITLGFYVRFIKEGRIKHFSIALSCIMALILGLQGVRGILILYAPLVGIEIIRRAYSVYCKEKWKRNDWIVLAWSAALFIISYVGTFFPMSVGQDISRNIRKGTLKLIEIVVPDVRKAVGLDDVGIVGRTCIIVLLFTALILLIEILLKMWKKKEITGEEWGFLVLLSSPIISALMVAYTTVESSERYYFLLVYVMACAVILECKKRKQSRIIVSAAIIVSIINIWNVYRPIIASKEPPTTDHYKVGRYLEENDYNIAYASFENANTITVLTNGEVRVAPVASVERMDICKWMSSTAWYVPNVPKIGKTIYIITEKEQELFDVFLEEHKEHMRCETQIGKFILYSSEYNYSNLGET